MRGRRGLYCFCETTPAHTRRRTAARREAPSMCVCERGGRGQRDLFFYAFASDHTSPLAILGAVWLNTAPHPSCVRVCMGVWVCLWVSVREIPHTAGDPPPKSGGAPCFRDVKGPLKRAMAVPSRQPRQALCALSCPICVCMGGGKRAFKFSFLST